MCMVSSVIVVSACVMGLAKDVSAFVLHSNAMWSVGRLL